MQVNIKNLINDVQCDLTVRELRWPDGVQGLVTLALVTYGQPPFPEL